MDTVQFKDAQDLYTNLSVDNIWLVLDSTKEQVNTKRDEVRELIGQRYHDLIDSADAIVGMYQTVHDFTHLVQDIEKSSKDLLDGENILQDLSSQENNQNKDKQYEGKTNKNSLEIQLEKADILTQAAVNIWELIDSKHLWEACETFLQAQGAYQELKKYDHDEQTRTTRKLSNNNKDYYDLLGLDQNDEIFQQLEHTPSNKSSNNHQNNNNNNMLEQADEFSIWQLYPYLRSHWSLVKEAQSKILQEAISILYNEEVGLESTCGAIRAMIVLGEVTARESIFRFLEARSTLISNMLSTSSSSKRYDDENMEGNQMTMIQVERLPQVLVTIQQTVVDVADLYVLGKGGDVTKTVDPQEIVNVVTKWVEGQSVFAGQVKQILNGVTDVQTLAKLQAQIIEIEQSGGASADAASELDLNIWRRACQASLRPQLWENRINGMFLYPMIYSRAFVERGSELLHQTFSKCCTILIDEIRSVQNFHEILSSTTSSVSTSDINLDIERKDENDNNNSDEDKRRSHEIAKMIVSDSATDRAQAAVILAVTFDSNIRKIVLEMNKVVDKDALRTSLTKQCGASWETFLRELEIELNRSVEQFQGSVKSITDDNAEKEDGMHVMDNMKRTLFLARVAEAIRACRELTKLLVETDLQEKQQRLLAFSNKTYEIWAVLSLQMSKGALEASLGFEDWKYSRDWKLLHSGWEQISINIEEGGGVGEEDDDMGLGDDDDEENLGGADSVALPGTVSPGVAIFSFLLSKQIRLIGDSKFISSASLLVRAVQSFLNDLMDGTTIDDDYLKQFTEHAVDIFRASSQTAILMLSGKGLELIQALYRAHLDSKKRTIQNEAAALQTVFDLYWFEWLLHIKQYHTENQYNLPELIESIVDVHIDPVDWTIYEPLLATRVKTYRERNALLFGPMLMVKAFFEAPKSAAQQEQFKTYSPPTDTVSAYDSNNVLYLGYLSNKPIARIPLLPIPSTIRSMHHRLSAQRKRTSSSNRSILSSPTARSASSAQLGGAANMNDASSAVKFMGQVGSNLFSQASSWLNR